MGPPIEIVFLTARGFSPGVAMANWELKPPATCPIGKAQAGAGLFAPSLALSLRTPRRFACHCPIERMLPGVSVPMLRIPSEMALQGFFLKNFSVISPPFS
jgi:hypothetical protein